MKTLMKMFEDQKAFNELIFNTTQEPMPSPGWRLRLKDLSLGLVEEAMEMLRTFEYKAHRRYKGKPPNLAHTHEELVDMFKMWMSLAHHVGFPMERLEELYYDKSRVVNQRYQTEWLEEIGNRDVVIVDIDEVLANYIGGLTRWIGDRIDVLLPNRSMNERDYICLTLNVLRTKKQWIDADSLGVTPQEWAMIKHQFRTTGGKRTLPVYEDAEPFLQYCLGRNWLPIMVTSRPIDRYPNIFTDTLRWLADNKLVYGYVWWSSDKMELVNESNGISRSNIVFAVDDSLTFVDQFRKKGVRAFHLDRGYHAKGHDPNRVDSLAELTRRLSEINF